MTYYIAYQSPIGTLYLVGDDTFLTAIHFEEEGAPTTAKAQVTPVLEETIRQLDGYFAGTQTEFTLPLAPSGTEFCKDVWNALCDIPYGQVASYKDVACMVGRERAARAVGLANNKNQIPIIVPCHRVVGSTGALVGYAGGLERKRWLLELEARV